VAWVFIAFVYFMVTKESIYYINVRNAYQLSALYARRISSRTVLFTSVPKEYVNEAKLRELFGNKVKNIWLMSDTKTLSEKVEQRDKIAMKLEAGETKLIKLSNEARMKSIKEGGRNVEEGPAGRTDVEAESGSAASRWIQPKQRPTHRIGKFGLIGKKVDTINWSRSELQRLIPEIDAERATHKAGEATMAAAVFIEFYTQADAQAAFQDGGGHQMTLSKAPRVVGMTPDDVVWTNLSMNTKVRMIRNAVTIALVVLTIIYWYVTPEFTRWPILTVSRSIPVAFVGAVSNINYLTKVAPFLSFINKCPKVILGVITGLLPTVMLAVLMAVLPIYLRFMAKMAGLPTYSAIELRTQAFYFWFQVIQVFIVTTLTSAASAAVPTIIKNPGSVTSLLAENLPKASNFYIDYFILQGLTFSSGALLQIVGLIVYKILSKILGSTPRKQYARWATLSDVGWGTVYPILR
jgi:calcium permeable stress-gated cation channel